MEDDIKVEAESNTEEMTLADNVNDIPMSEGVKNSRTLRDVVIDGKSLI